MMSKAEMEALRATINATSRYECRHQERTDAFGKLSYALMVKYFTPGGVVHEFPVRNRAEWDYHLAHRIDPVRLPMLSESEGQV